MLNYLDNIDLEAYTAAVNFNLETLSETKGFLNSTEKFAKADIHLQNVLARDDIDIQKYRPSEMPRSIHKAFLAEIDSYISYGRIEAATITEVLTYIRLSPSPDPEWVEAKLSPLQETYSEMVGINVTTEGSAGIIKMIYNRARIWKVLHGIPLTPGELQDTGFRGDQQLNLADSLCRSTGIATSLMGILEDTAGKSSVEAINFRAIAQAMLSYRKSLIDPKSAGIGQVKMDKTDLELMTQEATQAIRQNLLTVLKEKSEERIGSLDFLLSLQESHKLSGVCRIV